MTWVVGIFESTGFSRYPLACFEYPDEDMAEHAERLFDLYINEHDSPVVRTWVAVLFEVIPAPSDPRFALTTALNNLD